MKKIITAILLFGLISCLLCSCSKSYVASDPSLFQTSVEKITSICNWSTLKCYYHSVVKSQTEETKFLSKDQKEFWVEFDTIVNIGINMNNADISMDGNRIRIHLPEAEIIGDVKVDSNSFTEESFYIEAEPWLIETFLKTDITEEDMKRAASEAEEAVREEVMANTQLLNLAKERAKTLIEGYIDSLNKLSKSNYTVEWY